MQLHLTRIALTQIHPFSRTYVLELTDDFIERMRYRKWGLVFGEGRDCNADRRIDACHTD
jgi:hypothetical protein